MGVGMPKQLLLDEFGLKLMEAFDDVPYHVGSSLEKKSGWRDVDIRIILEDEEYKLLFGDPDRAHRNKKWRVMCLAFSLLGAEMTGLPIDFQIQSLTKANNEFKGSRSAIGISLVVK